MSDPRYRTKRRFRRRTVRIVVEYHLESGARRESATTLGSGGLFVQTDAPCRKGAVLTLRFQIAKGCKSHVINGRVVWCNSPGPDAIGAPGMGVEFTDRNATRDLAHELETLD